MIQRLLRGRGFYAALIIFSAFIYGVTAYLGFSSRVEKNSSSIEDFHHRRDVTSKHPSEEIAGQPEIDLWMKSFDVKTLRELIARRPHLSIALLAISVFIAAMSLGGIIFSLCGLLGGRINSIWRFKSQRIVLWSFGELVRVVILALVIVVLLPFARIEILAYLPAFALDRNAWLTISMLFVDVVVILSVLVFASNKGRSALKALGISQHTFASSVKTAMRAYLALFPWLFLLLFAVASIANKLGLKPPVEPIQQLIFGENRPAILCLTLLLACVIGPLAEECFFRGVVYAAIRKRTSWFTAAVLSAAVFSAVHTNIIGFLPIMALGCLLAYLYERTGSLTSPLAVHILHNTFLMTLAMLLKRLIATS